MGERAGRDEINTGFGDEADGGKGDIAGGLQGHAPGGHLYGLAHGVEVHVVEHDAVNGQGQGSAQLVQVLDFYFNQITASIAGTHAFDGRPDAIGAVDMVILDKHHIVEAGAVVLPAAHTHGVFIDVAQAGDGLARVKDDGMRAGDGLDELVGECGNARHTPQEVQGGALTSQQPLAGTGDFDEQGAGLNVLPILEMGLPGDAWVNQVEDSLRQRHAGDDSLSLGGDAPLQPGLWGQRGLGGDVALSGIGPQEIGICGLIQILSQGKQEQSMD